MHLKNPQLVVLIIFQLVLVHIVGCSGTDPVVPGQPGVPIPADNSQYTENSSRYIWGLWDVVIDTNNLSVEITPLRAAGMHINANKLLEDAPCSSCIGISNVQIISPNEISVDLSLTHPFPGLLKLSAFDVRGIFITESDYIFPSSGRAVALGDDVPRLLNANGYTQLFNPTEFPENSPLPPILKYWPGKYIHEGAFTATLNPFMAFSQTNPRRVFAAGTIETKTVQIYKPSDVIEFGYVVDGSWIDVDGEVTDPVMDFPPEANCPEAYLVQTGSSLKIGNEAGDPATVNVVVYDRQTIDTIDHVYIEIPDLFTGDQILQQVYVNTNGSAVYSGQIQNECVPPDGEYPILLRVTDTVEDPFAGHVDAWNISYIEVVEKTGWAKTWGGFYTDIGNGVASDSAGNIYSAGQFRRKVDFDPGPGVHKIEAHGNQEPDAYLSKLDIYGEFQWVRTWGDMNVDISEFVFCGPDDEIYVGGSFSGTVDLDPGPDEEVYMSCGGRDCFLSRFDSDGNLEWTRAWGSDYDTELARSMCFTQSGNMLIVGSFGSMVDFDPGVGETTCTSNGESDVFISEFTTSGDFIKVVTLGGVDIDSGLGVTTDSLGDIYISGGIMDVVDLDPGVGEVLYHAHGETDALLLKLDGDFNYEWGYGWGTYSFDYANEVCVDGADNVTVYGWFRGECDLDPTDGESIHDAKGSMDCFLSRFGSDGSFEWTRVWDGEWGADNQNDDTGTAMCIDESGNIYVTGWFENDADLDPGSGYDIRTSNGNEDCFLTKFNQDGIYQWARNWGGEGYYEMGLHIALDPSGNIFVTGKFTSEVDFDPGDGTDFHDTNGDDDVFLLKLRPDGNW